MKVSPETMKLLGLAPDASEDDFNARLAERLAPKPAPKVEEPAPAPKEAAPAISLADLDRIVSEKTQAALSSLAEANAKAQTEAAAAATKKARVDAVLDKGYRLGKVLKADFDLLRPSVEANPDAFEARLGSMPKVAPVDTELEAGGEPTTLGDGDGYRSKSDSLTYAAQFARTHNITLSEAEARIAELRAN